MKAIAILSLALLDGCAIVQTTYAPDGRIAYSIDCSGAALNWGMCHAKAGQICQAKGYDVLAGGSDSAGMAIAGPSGLLAAPITSRSMLIVCRS